MQIVTGYTGTAHITSAQDQLIKQGSFGTGSYILDVGSKMTATIYSNTEVRLADGAISHQGCVGEIAPGTYEAVTIGNGTQGMSRRDLIVARYAKDSGTNVESLSIVCIQGTPASSNPSTPSYNTGNIQNGDSPVDMPLYQVNINGVNISSVTKIASNVRTQAEIDTLLGNSTTFTASGESVLSSGNLRGTYDRSAGRTRIYLAFSKTDANLSTTDVLFKVPTSYRPGSTIYGTALMVNNSGVYVAGAYLSLDTSGNIKQVAGNTIRAGFGVFEY